MQNTGVTSHRLREGEIAQRDRDWDWGNRHKGTGSHPSTPSLSSSSIYWVYIETKLVQAPSTLCLSPFPKKERGLDPPLLIQQPKSTASPNPRGKHLECPSQGQKQQQPRHQTAPKGTAQALGTATSLSHSWATPRTAWSLEEEPPHQAELLLLVFVKLTQDALHWKSPLRSSSPSVNPAMPPCPQGPHLQSF